MAVYRGRIRITNICFQGNIGQWLFKHKLLLITTFDRRDMVQFVPVGVQHSRTPLELLLALSPVKKSRIYSIVTLLIDTAVGDFVVVLTRTGTHLPLCWAVFPQSVRA